MKFYASISNRIIKSQQYFQSMMKIKEAGYLKDLLTNKYILKLLELT